MSQINMKFEFHQKCIRLLQDKDKANLGKFSWY